MTAFTERFLGSPLQAKEPAGGRGIFFHSRLSEAASLVRCADQAMGPVHAPFFPEALLLPSLGTVKTLRCLFLASPNSKSGGSSWQCPWSLLCHQRCPIPTPEGGGSPQHKDHGVRASPSVSRCKAQDISVFPLSSRRIRDTDRVVEAKLRFQAYWPLLACMGYSARHRVGFAGVAAGQT